MKRRLFVQRSALGTFGLGVVSTDLFSLPFTREYAGVVNWLNEISLTSSVFRRSQAISAQSSFADITAEKNKYFAERGYEKMNDTCYFFGDQEEYCFYPIISDHKASGTKDLLMPVFKRNANQQWEFAQTLSGFQVDAMIKASYALRAKSSVKVQNLLLPVGRGLSGNKAGSYASRDGIVSTHTILKHGKAVTTCTVNDHTGMVYQETFTSRHSLHC